MTMEHRCGFRRLVSSAVVIRSPDGVAARGWICDISASGALVRSPLPAPLNGMVLVQFLELSRERGQPRAVVSGEIVRHTPDGFAIEWSEFSPAAVRSLLRELSEVSPARRASLLYQGSKHTG